jgi:glycosyltransferase involved in cell wall biosynthesis
MLLGRSTGGIGTHVAALSADLRDRGVDVTVVTHPLTANYFDLGPVRLCWPGSAGRVRALLHLRLLRALASSSDIVHAHGHQSGLLAATATLGLRRPKLIVSQHNKILEGSGRERLKRLSQRWVARQADLVTGASSDLVAEALSWGVGRAELAEVPSPRVPRLLGQRPADTATRARIRPTLLSSLADDQDFSAPLVVTISRIAPQKNLPVLVQAAARLRTPCTWVVIGDGDPRLLGTLRGQARDLGAPVHFVGARDDADVWLRAAEAFVLPSAWEARALVVQEAMAAGTPVVATDVGGLHDLVTGTGLLVIPGDAGAIAKATDRVLSEPGLRADLAARGREVAGTLPGGRDAVSQWLGWYAETLQMT